MRVAARKMSRNAKIPGFRPGKAPYNIILQRFGEELVFEEALETIGQEAYRAALEEIDLEPYAPGSMDEIVTREPLVIRYTVPLMPEVTLGDYNALRIDYQPPQVEDEAVEKVMEDLRQSRSVIEPKQGPAALSDVVMLDVSGELPEVDEGDPAALLDEKGISLLLEEETDWPFIGVTEKLLGIQAEEARDVEYLFPDDYRTEALQGKKASFHFKCLEVKSRTLPEWSDELAQSVGDVESLLDLRLKVRESLLEEARRKVDDEYAEQVMEAVVAQSTINHPPVMLEREQDDMLRDFDRRLRSQNLSLEDYMKIEDKTEAEVRSELEPRAQARLNRALVLTQVVEDEKLEVQPAEVDEELERIAAGFGESAAQLRSAFDTPVGRHRISLDLLGGKAMARLVAIAKGEGHLPPEVKAPSSATAGGSPDAEAAQPDRQPTPAEGADSEPASAPEAAEGSLEE